MVDLAIVRALFAAEPGTARVFRSSHKPLLGGGKTRDAVQVHRPMHRMHEYVEAVIKDVPGSQFSRGDERAIAQLESDFVAFQSPRVVFHFCHQHDRNC